MKIHFLLSILILGTCSSQFALAQGSPHFKTQAIKSSHLQISDQMTTHLIFPQGIKSVDRGNRNILVQKAQEVENVLQVKAQNSELPNSNLTVITEDGSFYSFKVAYEQSPPNLNWNIQPHSNETRAKLKSPNQPSSEIWETARLVSKKHRSIPAIRQRRFMTGLALTGIYIDQDLLYFQIQLQNQTNIAYDTEQFRFFIRDNRQSKRSASQELEQIPQVIWGDPGRIPAQSTQTLVIALRKFTIPNQKHLAFELMEKNGGRNLKIKVKNRQLMKAKVLN